jgi:TetR/AcrR family transcriptional regulator
MKAKKNAKAVKRPHAVRAANVTAGEAPRANARTLQKEATRAAILQAALQVFAEHGYAGSSTRDIAALAGAHHALIKYYFQNKETLWREAVTFLFKRQAEELTYEPAPGALNTARGRREHAREVLRRWVIYCARHPEHARLMVQESVRDGERLHWVADTFINRTSAGARALVDLLQKEKMLPADVSPVALIYIIVGAAQMFYTLAPEVRRVWKVDPASDAAIEAHVDALLAVFIR